MPVASAKAYPQYPKIAKEYVLPTYSINKKCSKTSLQNFKTTYICKYVQNKKKC
jgi:hypothetical protein